MRQRIFSPILHKMSVSAKKLPAGILTFVLLFVWLFSGVPRLPLLDFPPNSERALAANGDIAIFREAGGLDQIDTSVTDIDWDTTVRSDGVFALQPNNVDIDLADPGHYLVMYSVPTESAGGNNRSEIQSWLRKNNSTNLNYGRGQGFIRRAGNADEGYNQGAAILTVAAGDDIRLQMQRSDSNSATVQRRSNMSGINILKLNDAWDYLLARPTIDQTFGSDQNFTDVTLATDDEIDTESFARSGAAITLKKSGHYLVTYNVGITHADGNSRINDETRLVIDNGSPVEIPGSRVTTYIRGSNGTNDGMTSWVGIISANADDILKLQVRRESEQDASGHRIKAAETGITIAKLPDSAEYIRLGELGGGQDLSESVTQITWDELREEDLASFDHDTVATERINIETAGDYLFFHSLYADRPAGDGTRETQLLQWRKNGSSLYQYGSSGQYNRGDQGSKDARTSGSSNGIIMHDLTASDWVELTQVNEAANATATYVANRMGLQGVNIASLFETNYPLTKQLHFRWRDDSTALDSNGGWLGLEDDNGIGSVLDSATTYRLRIAVANTGTAAESAARTYELQWGEKNTTCQAISAWSGVADTVGDAFEMALSPNFSDGQTTLSGLLTNSEGYTFGNGQARESADTTTTIGPLPASGYTELEYSIKAGSGSTAGSVYCFRVIDKSTGLPLDIYSEYPELRMWSDASVQKIIGSISNTTAKTVALPNAIGNIDRAFLLFDFSGGSSNDRTPGEATCTAYISSTTQITIEKSSASGTCNYAIYVVEAKQGEFVVRGRGAITLDGNELSDSGAANNRSDIFHIDKVFVPGMSRSNADSNGEWNETYATLELTNNTTVTAERGSNSGADTAAVVRYEVVEWLYPGVRVQSKEKTLTNLGTTIQTDAIDSPVALDRSFLYATARHTDNGLAQTAIAMALTGTDEVSFMRGGGTYDSVARWWVIEFPPNTATVQRGTGVDSSNSNDNIDITIPAPVDLDKSFPINFMTNSGTGSAFPRGRSRSDLQNPTLLNYNGGYSGNTATYAWQVIDTSNLVMPSLDQDSYRFYENTDTLDPVVGLASEETITPYIQNGEAIRLRLGTAVTAAALPADDWSYLLQYAEGKNCSPFSAWNDVGAPASGSIWRGFDNATANDDADLAASLLDGGGNNAQSYSEDRLVPPNPNVISQNARGEWDVVLQNNGARHGAYYCFRLIRSDGEAFDTYSVYPQVVTGHSLPWSTF